MLSDNVTKGVDRAPNRSLFAALGLTREEQERPLVGVVCSQNEIVPGHMNLDKIAEAVKAGVRMAGGTPIEFPAIAVCDGIAMGHIGMKYSLVTRDLIADSTECMAIAHQFDALVMIPNCDKNVPGLLMAAARINVPTIFVSGGPMLAGHLSSGKRTCLSDMFEAVGAYHAGTLDEDGVEEYIENACPSCGSCSGMYTANSMNCLTEAIGMGLPVSYTHLDVYKRQVQADLRIALTMGNPGHGQIHTDLGALAGKVLPQTSQDVLGSVLGHAQHVLGSVNGVVTGVFLHGGAADGALLDGLLADVTANRTDILHNCVPPK